LCKKNNDTQSVAVNGDREDKENSVGIELRNTSYELTLLPKIHLGWWYFAWGISVGLHTPPLVLYAFGSEQQHIGSFFQAKAAVNFMIVHESGWYFPLGKNANHHILLTLRGS
jgi:hypothetical protein